LINKKGYKDTLVTTENRKRKCHFHILKRPRGHWWPNQTNADNMLWFKWSEDDWYAENGL